MRETRSRKAAPRTVLYCSKANGAPVLDSRWCTGWSSGMVRGFGEIDSYLGGRARALRSVLFLTAVARARHWPMPERNRRVYSASCVNFRVINDDPMLLKSLRDGSERDGHSVVVVLKADNPASMHFSRRGGGAERDSAAVITYLRHAPCRWAREHVAAAIKSSSPETRCHPADRGWGQSVYAAKTASPNTLRSAAQQARNPASRAQSARCVNGIALTVTLAI